MSRSEETKINIMQSRLGSTLGILLLIFAINFGFQNCGEDGFKAKYYSEYVQSQQIAPSPFDDKKVVFDDSFKLIAPVKSSQEEGETIHSTYIEAGQELVVIVDNACAEKACAEDASYDNKDSYVCASFESADRIPDLPKQAYRLEMNAGMSEKEISEQIASEVGTLDCLVGVTNSSEIHLISMSAQTNDPQADDQGHLKAIRFWEAWDFFENGGNQAFIAVVDSGNFEDHEDSNRLIIKSNQSGDGGASNDITDCNGHGTFVSGIINANTNNSVGISGMTRQRVYATIRAFQCSGSTPT
ncbi:MAG: S8 family serine peptidase, partial [Pseudomonadota bacterium]